MRSSLILLPYRARMTKQGFWIEDNVPDMFFATRSKGEPSWPTI
jgi:hypothetical protein